MYEMGVVISIRPNTIIHISFPLFKIIATIVPFSYKYNTEIENKVTKRKSIVVKRDVDR